MHQSPRWRSRSSCLPVNLLRAVQLLVSLLVRREAKRLLRAEYEYAEHCEAVVEQPVYSSLQRLVEVYEHVPAQDHVEFRERPVGDEIVQGKYDVPRERLVEERPSVLREIVIGECPFPTCSDVILRVFLHSIERKNPFFRFLKHHLIDVGRIDAAAIVETFLLQKDRQR